MDLKQKIGQLFMLRGFQYLDQGAWKEREVWELLEKGWVSGIQVRPNISQYLLKKARSRSPFPLFFAADMENGCVENGKPGTPMADAMALGALRSEKIAYQWANLTAREARYFGVNMIYGPVLDIAMEPSAPHSNIRCFSSDPHEVVRLGAAVIRGYQDAGMIVAAKHYPGLGRIAVDTHIERGIIECSKREFEKTELWVYKELIRKTGLNGIMSGHLEVPSIDPGRLATVSRKLLRYLDRYNFKGIVMTDSLAMSGLTMHDRSKSLLEEVVLSGHDLILPDYRRSPKAQLEELFRAVESGRISEERIDASVKKILHAKEFIAQTPPPSKINLRSHLQTSVDQHRSSITIRGKRSHLSKLRKQKKLWIVARPLTQDTVSHELVMDRGPSLIQKHLKHHFSKDKIMVISESPAPVIMEQTLDKARNWNDIIFVAYALQDSYKGSTDLDKRLLALIHGLRNKIKILVLFGNPYAARELPELECLLFAYSGPLAEQAAVEVLAGKAKARGKLPVTIPFKLKTKTGI